MTKYANLDYGQDELQEVMREHYDRIIKFVVDSEFQLVLKELKSLHPSRRPSFVQDVLINEQELKRRGINIPEGILIQRSAFGDRRPTLFAVKHFLPEKYSNVWENVNLTFDNEFIDGSVSRDKDVCWQEPLNPHIQAAAIAKANIR